jgi:hypothetical protein
LGNDFDGFFGEIVIFEEVCDGLVDFLEHKSLFGRPIHSLEEGLEFVEEIAVLSLLLYILELSFFL